MGTASGQPCELSLGFKFLRVSYKWGPLQDLTVTKWDRLQDRTCEFKWGPLQDLTVTKWGRLLTDLANLSGVLFKTLQLPSGVGFKTYLANYYEVGGGQLA